MRKLGVIFVFCSFAVSIFFADRALAFWECNDYHAPTGWLTTTKKSELFELTCTNTEEQSESVLHKIVISRSTAKTLNVVSHALNWEAPFYEISYFFNRKTTALHPYGKDKEEYEGRRKLELFLARINQSYLKHVIKEIRYDYSDSNRTHEGRKIKILSTINIAQATETGSLIIKKLEKYFPLRGSISPIKLQLIAAIEHSAADGKTDLSGFAPQENRLVSTSERKPERKEAEFGSDVESEYDVSLGNSDDEFEFDDTLDPSPQNIHQRPTLRDRQQWRGRTVRRYSSASAPTASSVPVTPHASPRSALNSRAGMTAQTDAEVSEVL